MSFREQLNAIEAEPTVQPAARANDQTTPTSASDAYKLLKERIHLKLLDRFDLAALETLTPDMLRQEISTMVGRLLQEEPEAINDIERRTLIRDIQHEMLGFGPLEPLMADPTVSDILVNSLRPRSTSSGGGRLELTNVTLHRRQAPDAHHRQDRLARRAPHRRIQPDGRCAPARRLARQRHHPAAGARRARCCRSAVSRTIPLTHGEPGRRAQDA